MRQTFDSKYDRDDLALPTMSLEHYETVSSAPRIVAAQCEKVDKFERDSQSPHPLLHRDWSPGTSRNTGPRVSLIAPHLNTSHFFEFQFKYHLRLASRHGLFSRESLKQ